MSPDETKIIEDIDLDNDPKKAVAIIADGYKGAKFENASAKFKDLEIYKARKLKWIHMSLFVYSLLGGMLPTARSNKINTLCEQVGYKRAQLYNFYKAGDKLVWENFEFLPNTIKEFLKTNAKSSKIVEIRKFCEFEGRFGEPRIIYGGRQTVKKSPEFVYFITSTPLLGKEIVRQPSSEVIDGKTIDKEIFICGECSDCKSGSKPNIVDLILLPPSLSYISNK